MATAISHTDYYELTNSYTGPSFPLAVNPSSLLLGLRVASKDDYSLSWQFLTAPDPTKFNICTHYQGTSYCLDIVGGDKITPHLAQAAYVTGQQWTLIPSTSNTYKLSNDYSGVGYYLDTYSNTLTAFMSMGDYSGQYWTLNDEGAQPGGASSSSPISTAVVTVTVTQPQSRVSSLSSAANTFATSSIPTLTGSTGAPAPLSGGDSSVHSAGAKVGAIFGPCVAAIILGIAIYVQLQ